MNGARALPPSGARAAVLVGMLAGFVALVNLVRLVRLALLTDPEPAWAAARLLLGLGVAAAAASAAVLAASALCVLVANPRLFREAAPLPFRPWMLVVLATGALLLGSAVRFTALWTAFRPGSFWTTSP